MPSQYALVYFLGSTILGSIMQSLFVFLVVNIPNGTWYFDGFGVVILMSILLAMIASLPFHAWLNWIWYKGMPVKNYDHFFRSFMRKYWIGSAVFIAVIYAVYLVFYLIEFNAHGRNTQVLNAFMIFLPLVMTWAAYAPLGWWILDRLKEAMKPIEMDV